MLEERTTQGTAKRLEALSSNTSRARKKKKKKQNETAQDR
jgi:hypothetical protein